MKERKEPKDKKKRGGAEGKVRESQDKFKKRKKKEET